MVRTTVTPSPRVWRSQNHGTCCTFGRSYDAASYSLVYQRDQSVFFFHEIWTRMLTYLLAIFYLHRGFFARAIEDNPEDPLGSKYAPSVLAAYNSASTFVGLIKSLYSQHPKLTERLWFLFTHVFSCSVRLFCAQWCSNDRSFVSRLFWGQ